MEIAQCITQLYLMNLLLNAACAYNVTFNVAVGKPINFGTTERIGCDTSSCSKAVDGKIRLYIYIN